MLKLLASYAKTVKSKKLVDLTEDKNVNKNIIKDKKILHNENIPKLNSKFWKNYINYTFKDKINFIYDIELFLNYPNYQVLLYMWNLGETTTARLTRSINLQKINWIKKFYISPDLFNIIFPNNNIDSEMSTEVKISRTEPIELTNNELFSKNIYDEKKQSIRIRFISNLEYDFNQLFNNFIFENNKDLDPNYFKKYNKNQKFFFKNILEKSNPDLNFEDLKKHFKKTIVHFHGGGFIAMSSSTHQIYLRKISNSLNVPIFSIDYRLAPQVRHPNLLYDCILGYYWVVQFIKKVIGVEDPEIILLGDSAGGNLVASTSLWILENNLKPPLSLHMNYPCLCLRYDTYTPSIFIAFKDLFLNYNGMKIALELYLNKESDCEKDSYLSPLYMKDKYFKMLPQTYLSCGTDDPLINDCFRFIKRKIDNNKENITFDCFKYLPHGLCGMDNWNPGKIFHNNILKHIKSVLDN